MEDFLSVIRTRRSVRAYKPDGVPEELLDKVLEAGVYAPTGRNMQSPVIVAVTDKATRDYVSGLNAKVLGVDTDPYYGAPVILLVLADGNVNTFVEDGACVLENMMLAAASLGLGTVWVHREREIFESEAGKKLLAEWGVKGNLRGVGSIAIGYAAAPANKAAARKADYIYKIQPSDGTVYR